MYYSFKSYDNVLVVLVLGFLRNHNPTSESPHILNRLSQTPDKVIGTSVAHRKFLMILISVAKKGSQTHVSKKLI